MLKKAQVMKIVTGLSPIYSQLVKKFIFNIPEEFNKAGSRDYMKEHVRICYIGFFPAIFNEYLGRSELIATDMVPPMKIIVHELTDRVYEDWPSKGLLPNASLSVKYVILNQIRVSNWAHINRSYYDFSSQADIPNRNQGNI